MFEQVDDWIIDTSCKLGDGTFGKVLRCYRQNKPDEKHCVKIIPKFNIALRDSDIEKSIMNEMKAFEVLSQTNDKSENVVEIIQVIDKPQYKYIFMEQCDYDLQKEFNDLLPDWFSRNQQIDIIQQIIKGAYYLKCQQLIHRDIKPQNILVKIIIDSNNKQRKVYKIADFGFSRILENMYVKANLTLVGTMNYLAPEIYLLKQFSAKCDIYSYGLLFYQIAFNGELPFKKEEGQLKHFENIKNSQFKCNQLGGEHGHLITGLIEKMIVYLEENRISFEELNNHEITSLKLEQNQYSLSLLSGIIKPEANFQAQIENNNIQTSEKIYKIINIYYHKFLLCQHVRNHFKLKFQSPDQYLFVLSLLIGWIGYVSIKYAYSLIILTHADFEEIFLQQYDLPQFLDILQIYLEQAKKIEKYSQINQNIRQSLHLIISELKSEHNEIEIKKLRNQDKNKQINQQYQDILQNKLCLIRKLECENVNCKILCSELNDLKKIKIDQKQLDQKDLDLIKRIEMLYENFSIVQFRIIDVKQIYDPKQL